MWAKGLFSAEAAVELLIGHRLWLDRTDFREIGVELGWETFSGRVMAAVDFEAVAGALDAGALPCSGSLSELASGLLICGDATSPWLAAAR